MPDSLCCGSSRCPLLEEQRAGSLIHLIGAQTGSPRRSMILRMKYWQPVAVRTLVAERLVCKRKSTATAPLFRQS